MDSSEEGSSLDGGERQKGPGQAEDDRSGPEKMAKRADALYERLVAEGVDPGRARAIADEERKTKQDLGIIKKSGPLSFEEQLHGMRSAPQLDEVMQRTRNEPGTCEQCGQVMADDMTRCPSCGWVAHPQSAQPVLGYIKQDVTRDGVVLFQEGDMVRIEGESPDPARPEYKYLATNTELDATVLLSEQEVSCAHPHEHVEGPEAVDRLEELCRTGLLTRSECEQAKEALLRKLE